MDAKELAEKLDRSGKCVVCEVEVEGRRRGLCTTDYNRFLSAIRQLPSEKREMFESKLIERGRLLPSKQGQRAGIEDNVFAEELTEFLLATAPTDEEVEDAKREAEDVIRRNAERVRNEKLRRKRKKRTPR